MGHNRLGRLPRTRRWREVVALLDSPALLAEAVASATAHAADKRFAQLSDDPALAYAFWILARVTSAARSERFLQELAWVGVHEAPETSGLGLISGVLQHLKQEFGRLPQQSDFTEIATLAVGRALTETVGREGPGLFSSTAEDAQRAFRLYSTRAKFSELARTFFADYMARSLRSVVDRDLSNHLGPGKALQTTADSGTFLDALSLHAWQAARIVEEFSGGWYSLHNWQTSGDISLEEARRFTAQAVQKLRGEFERGTSGT